MLSHHTKQSLRKAAKRVEKSPVKHTLTAKQNPPIKSVLAILGLTLPKRRWQRRLLLSTVGVIVLGLGCMFAIGQWYIYQERSTPLTLGVSFVPDYASFLGLQPNTVLTALLNQVHVRQIRFTSYWSDIEVQPGQYNFSELDQEFALADKAHASVTLAIGLRQPGYPECHPPSFIQTAAPEIAWYPSLEKFMTATINRYKHNPALKAYQLENEYFLQGFGTCSNDSRQRLVSEYNLTRSLDPAHPIIIGRSNNDLGWPVGAPSPSEYSVSIYQRVWDANVTHRYIQYPFPSWYYAFLAGWQKIVNGKDMIIGELQAEPWAPHSLTIPETTLAEQNKSFTAGRLQKTISFGKQTGMKTIDLWGAEYWYYRLTVLKDPSVWNTARQLFRNQQT